MVEKYDFKTSPNVIMQIIKRQSGNKDSSVKEQFSNASDAQAKHIICNITNNTIDINDDGCGMSVEQLRTKFGIFGKSEKVGQLDQIGEFGMGRGQLFALGRNEWHTQDHIAIIDIEKDGLSYTIEDSSEFVHGCHVHIDLYKEKEIEFVGSFVRELMAYIQFPAINVQINGNLVPRLEGTPIVKDNNRFYPNEDANGCRIYVKGVYVTNWRNTGIKGIVLISDATLNFARNEIIHDEKYKAIEDFVRYVEAEQIKHMDKRANYPNLNGIIRAFNSHYITREDIAHLKFIPSFEKGTYFSPHTSNGRVLWNIHYVHDNQYAIGNEWKNDHGGLVVDLDGDQKDFIKRMELDVRDIDEETDDLAKIEEFIHKKEGSINEAALTGRLATYCNLFRNMADRIARVLNISRRAVKFVNKATFGGQTDGSTWIKLNADQISLKKSKTNNVIAMAFTIIHEYSHDDDSSNGSHDVNFYERFHANYKQCADIIAAFADRRA